MTASYIYIYVKYDRYQISLIHENDQCNYWYYHRMNTIQYCRTCDEKKKIGFRFRYKIRVTKSSEGECYCI